jgi:erythromycin esterase
MPTVGPPTPSTLSGNDNRTGRRKFLTSVGAIATVLTAGCSSSSDDEQPQSSETAATQTPEQPPAQSDQPTATQTPEQTPESTQSESESIADAVRQYATPVETVNPTEPLDDLGFLRGKLSDASIIGMGEVTHGARDFFRFKHRLVRYMVEELGLRTFALEADFAKSLAIDRYVRTGQGDPADAIGGLGLWVWDVESVLAMVEWMREFNEGRDPGDKIRFYGVDMYSSSGSIAELEAFFRAANDDFLDSRTEVVETLQSANLRENKSALESVRGIVPALQDYLETNEDALVTATSREEYTLARQLTRTLKQDIEHMVSWHQNPNERRRAARVRTRAMAQNARWVFEREETDKLALWMHNLHLNRNRSGDTGGFLNDWYGEDYYAIGMEFNRGSFQARRIKEASGNESGLEIGEVQKFTVGPAPQKSLPGVLSKLGMQYAFVDLAAVESAGRLGAWLEEGPQRTILTSTFSPTLPPDRIRFAQEPIAGDFNGLLFVEEIQRARPL